MKEHEYLYIAQNITDKKAHKYHVYKVGCSKSPEKRIKALSGSASTHTYRLVYKVLLPRAIKDIHILAHKHLQHVVLYKNKILQNEFIKIYGKQHSEGLQRRRELIMFGAQCSEQIVKRTFHQIVTGMKEKTSNNYKCTDTMCTTSKQNSSTSLCNVCEKYIQTIWNYIAYHKSHMNQTSILSITHTNQRIYNMLELERIFSERIQRNHNISGTQMMKKVNVGEFWLICPDGRKHKHLRIAYVKAINIHNQVALVQWWSPDRTHHTITSVVSSVFKQETRDGEPYRNLDHISLTTGWECSLRMKKGRRKGQRLIYKLDQEGVKIHLKKWVTYYKYLNTSKTKKICRQKQRMSINF
jgi:hypothetical protein